MILCAIQKKSALKNQIKTNTNKSVISPSLFPHFKQLLDITQNSHWPLRNISVVFTGYRDNFGFDFTIFTRNALELARMITLERADRA